MRVPRGFIDNFKDVIFKHDAQFLETVCSELNIPFREAKQKILGIGTTAELIVKDEALNENQQCEFFVLNTKTSHYMRCFSRQAPGLCACENHSCFLRIPSTKVIHKKDILDLSVLNWIWQRKEKKYYLADDKMNVYTADDQKVKNKKIWCSKDNRYYLLDYSLC